MAASYSDILERLTTNFSYSYYVCNLSLPAGRTNIQGVYAAGDASVIAPAQLTIAAAEGVRAAAGINTDLTQIEFLE